MSALTTFIQHCSGYTLQSSLATEKNKRHIHFWDRDMILLFKQSEKFVLCYCFKYICCLVSNPSSQIMPCLNRCLSFISTVFFSYNFNFILIFVYFVVFKPFLNFSYYITEFLLESSTPHNWCLVFIKLFCIFFSFLVWSKY